MLEESLSYWPNGQLRARLYWGDLLIEGECKWWYSDGSPDVHAIYSNGLRHGECKSWMPSGSHLLSRDFYQNYNNITDEVTLLVDDIDNITDEERMIIKLQFGIDCLTNS